MVHPLGVRVIGAAATVVCAFACTPASARAQASRTTLTDYEGVYAYQGATSIALVAAESILVAVLDEAKYPLRTLGRDLFLNGAGDTIPFRRGADGQVTGFVERGTFFARRSRQLDPAVVEAVRARPRGGAYAYAAPPDMGDGIRVGSVADIGLDTASVTRLVGRIADGTYPDVHSVLVYQGGRLVVEEYFYGYDRDRPHQMRSASKSFESALVGIAVDQGLLGGEDTTRVLPRLPYDTYANPDPRKQRLVLRDLLTMRSGLACDDWDGASPGNESRMYQSSDWVKFVLDLPMADDPGTRGHYCSGNVKVAGRLVERAAGVPLPEFAQRHLFDPLGIKASNLRWNYRLDSTNATTFGQLYLRPRDMLKFGLLFAQHGEWNGRQVISRQWVERSTAKWSTVGDQDYGYFWWHQWVNAQTPDGPQRVDMVVATGNGGQKIFLIPSMDAVVVMTGGNFNVSSPSSAMMAREILPALLARRAPGGAGARSSVR